MSDSHAGTDCKYTSTDLSSTHLEVRNIKHVLSAIAAVAVHDEMRCVYSVGVDVDKVRENTSTHILEQPAILLHVS